MANMVRINHPKARHIAANGLAIQPNFVASGTASGPDIKNVSVSLVNNNLDTVSAVRIQEFGIRPGGAPQEYRWKAVYLAVADGAYTLTVDGLDETGNKLGDARQSVVFEVQKRIVPKDPAIRAQDGSGPTITFPTQGEDISADISDLIPYGSESANIVTATIDPGTSGAVSATSISNDLTNSFWCAEFPPLTASSPEITHTLTVVDAQSNSASVNVEY